jgi:putative redox protein
VETIQTTYVGELRTESKHIKSGNQIFTDVPVEHGGKGQSFSPTDLFCASIVSSMLSVMGGVAKDPAFKGSIDGTIARTTKIMMDDPHQVSEIIIEFDMTKNSFTEVQKKLLEESVLNSQVGRSLKADLKQTITFTY